ACAAALRRILRREAVRGATREVPMQSATAPTPILERPLTLDMVVRDLIADGLVPSDVGEKLLRDRRLARNDTHPLVVVSEQRWRAPHNAKKTLALEGLTQWLAERVQMPYLHVDPFKIDFATVTKVMSNAYASRFKILP